MENLAVFYQSDHKTDFRCSNKFYLPLVGFSFVRLTSCDRYCVLDLGWRDRIGVRLRSRVVHRPGLNPEVAYLVVGEELSRHSATQLFNALLGPVGPHG